jgi:hypothetical protein
MRGNGLTLKKMRDLYHESKNAACVTATATTAENEPPSAPPRAGHGGATKPPASPQGVDDFATPLSRASTKKAAASPSRSAAALKGWETRRAN